MNLNSHSSYLTNTEQNNRNAVYPQLFSVFYNVSTSWK